MHPCYASLVGPRQPADFQLIDLQKRSVLALRRAVSAAKLGF
jgi:hypothetical protein